MFRFALFLYVLVVVGLMAVNVSEAAGPLAAQGVPAFFKARVNVGHSAVSHDKRQGGSIPDIPPQCQSTCDPVNTVLAGNGCSPSTCCQASFEMGYFNCFTCVGGLINITDYSTPQQLIDALIDECASAGIALPKLTFPGQNPNQALSSVVSTKASAPLSLPQSSISISAQTTSAIQQSTITAVPTSSSSTLVQSTITAPPSTTTSSTGAAATPTTTSRGVKAADSRLALGMATALLGACFYFAL